MCQCSSDSPGVAALGKRGGRQRDVVFAASFGGTGDQAPGEDDPRVATKQLGSAGDDAVLAGAARSDNEDQRAAPRDLFSSLSVAGR